MCIRDRLGTAGFTALLCAFAVKAKEELLMQSKVEDVLVTGSTGGVGMVAVIIGLANVVRTSTNDIYDFMAATGFDPNTYLGFGAISLLAFVSAWLLGSSSRFGAVTVILTALYGIEYLPWFFAVDFAGYILSPMHKCVAIGKMYFGTKLSYYGKLLSGWALLVVGMSGVLFYV